MDNIYSFCMPRVGMMLVSMDQTRFQHRTLMPWHTVV